MRLIGAVLIVGLLGFVAIKALTEEDCGDFAGFSEAKKEKVTRQVLARSSVTWTSDADLQDWVYRLGEYCRLHDDDDFTDVEASFGW